VDSSHFWVDVAQPLEYGRPFKLKGEHPPADNQHRDERVEISTQNVRRLHVSVRLGSPKDRLLIDAAAVAPSKSGWYLRGKNAWVPDENGPPDAEKSARKSGPFKLAFGNTFVLVYGTAGDESENRELLELARWISEAWWYRGNGSTIVISDREFLARGAALAARNVILFGNAETNAAWKGVVPASCPVQAKRGSLRLGEKSHEGADLAALFVYPRADGSGLIGAFADTGPAGTRLLATIPVFGSGVGLPDYALFGPDILTKGDGGVLAAGWFDSSWRL
jgi:hypothetical protein